ncbi:glucosyltransferase [Spirochaetia bacterium]|nr:glucosyltransferase [Spirochaetia bacterium]
MTSKKIPIVFSANNYYVPYMAVTIQSIMENASRNRQYIFFVFHREIGNENMDLLRKQIAVFPQFSIKFIDVTQYIGEYNLFVSKHVTIETYFRLLIPEILSEYQKAIYLDGDMICCTNIASLYDIDLENNLLAAVRDVGVSWYYSPEHTNSIKSLYVVLLNLQNPDKYFCAGMTVFNIELFRKTISTDKLFELATSREWQVHDQDVLNFLAEGKTLLLPFHWNFMHTSLSKYLPEHLRKDYNEAEKNPKIIHYKPWDCASYIPHFELFWKYATRTPFIDVILERMEGKNLLSEQSFSDRILDNITHRKGLGLKFILLDCLKAWLSRDKVNNE